MFLDRLLIRGLILIVILACLSITVSAWFIAVLGVMYGIQYIIDRNRR